MIFHRVGYIVIMDLSCANAIDLDADSLVHFATFSQIFEAIFIENVVGQWRRLRLKSITGLVWNFARGEDYRVTAWFNVQLCFVVA